MMKRNLLLLLATMTVSAGFAQLGGPGYYRVQNKTTSRYITMVDNRGAVDVASQTADLGAIQTIKGFENVVSNPGSVIYITPSGDGYMFKCQGTSTKDIIEYDLRIMNMGDGTYSAYASSHGLTKYLNDSYGSAETGYVDTNDSRTRAWYILPLGTDGDNYFAVTPDVNAGSNYYTTFYASFPFSFTATDSKAYIVKEIDEEMGAVIWQEVTGSVPASTPVIIESASADAANNKLNILTSTPSAVSGNLMKGVYFNSGVAGHVNRVVYNAKTMRVLGKMSDGSIGFVKASLDYIPANTAYITVSTTAPNELRLVDRAGYEALLKAPVTVKVTQSDREYGDENPSFYYTVEGGSLKGRPVMSCAATPTSPVGEYDITIEKGSIKNENVTLVPGKMSIKKAMLEVEVANEVRYVGYPNPTFIIVYEGWKNGENESVLTKQAVATTEATEESPIGVYEIVVSGAESPNYDFNYTNGTLTIEEDPSGIESIMKKQAVDVYSVYGYKVRSQVRSLGELPKGLYIINGKKVMVK